MAKVTKNNRKIEIFSFFSGVGFLDLGFADAGFDIVFVNEYDKNFLKAYQFARQNDNKKPLYGYSNDDMRIFLDDDKWYQTFPKYDERSKKIIGFIGGPPCPDFSIGGKNEGGTGKNGQLTKSYVDLINARNPDFFLLENVKGLFQTKKHRNFYDSLKCELENNKYKLFDSVENSLEYGAPQYRERLFLIGFKKSFWGKNINYAFGRNKIYNLKEILALTWPNTNEFKEKGNLKKPSNIMETLTVEYWFKQNNTIKHFNSNDYFTVHKKERFVSIAEGDTKGKSFKRLHRWRFAPTVAFGNNEVHLHPYLPRRLSIAEALAIQSLPINFKIPTDLIKSAQFKIVGNGVPYLMARGIALDIYNWINDYLINRR